MRRRTAPGGVAIYIPSAELERRGLCRNAEGYAAVAREALRSEGVPACDLTLEVFEGAAGAMLFCRLRLGRR